MKYKAILFDMDGTLLPMDMEEFTTGYFKLLARKLAKYGIEPEKLVKVVWAGVAAMVKNDGSVTNEKAFWETFQQMTGITDEKTLSNVEADCLEFYGNEFHQAKFFTSENPLAVEAVRVAKEKAEIVALATNPLFPMVGQKTRMSWVGLTSEDFELVTSFESDCYCKPNPKYFLSVCERLGVKPEECLMVGNDEDEDGYAATKAGMDCYLVTDCLIKNEKCPWTGKQGSFSEMVEMIKNL